MTFPLGKTASLYLAGYNFSGNANGYDMEGTTSPEDVTVFSPSFHKTQEPGLAEAKLSVKGYYSHSVDPDVSGYLNQLLAAVRADTVGLWVDPSASTTAPAAGDPADLWVSHSIDRKLSVAADSYVTLDAEIHVKSGLALGDVLFAETAFNASPFSSTGYDQGGAAWSSGTYRYRVVVQVTAYTSGLAALLVQTSTDNSTWTTRGTFPAISAVGGYALDLNTTLDRYLRIRDTGVATILGAWARLY